MSAGAATSIKYVCFQHDFSKLSCGYDPQNTRQCYLEMPQLTDFYIEVLFIIYIHVCVCACVFFFLNQFTPSKVITPLRCKWLLGVKEKEKTLEGIVNPILNRKQEINLFSCSKKHGRSVNWMICEPIYSY